MRRLRQQLEEIESMSLAPYGLRSAASRGRQYPEAESATRTAFTRDRDRIIHSTAFRRLMYKPQVFVFYDGDPYRTRSTLFAIQLRLSRGNKPTEQPHSARTMEALERA